ncbi:DUF1236 domain-containing protein [Mesorhizobium sp. SP-1A]|jgi:hypothetical protein|uniref:DUF1236 domain-containing protein n=1 Tax=Mesorhizobium sp. SP-1A TaxID=3077840 RepID=UPI0028F6EE90|nr:DUF1236 domain-containing protein [Mesorhizobium sp. SP-1A]
MRPEIRTAIVAAALLAATGAAAAQDVVIEPQQQTVIREYVHRKPLASIDLLGVQLNIGSVLPDTVELHQIEAPDVRYRYVVVEGRTLIVDPETRRVVEVLE